MIVIKNLFFFLQTQKYPFRVQSDVQKISDKQFYDK